MDSCLLPVFPPLGFRSLRSHITHSSSSTFKTELKFSDLKESPKLTVLLPPRTIKTMSSLRFSGDNPAASRRRHHFLDACYLCKKPIDRNEDIFMYRGDTPFCSRECRWEQMDMDEALENARANSLPLSSSSLPMKRKPTLIYVIPSNCEEKKCFRADATAVVAG